MESKAPYIERRKLGTHASIFRAASVGAVVCLIFIWLSHANATSLTGYRERVGLAIAKLQAYDDRGPHPTASEVHEVGDLLPSTETVEWNGTKTEVDNSWLRPPLDQLERGEGDRAAIIMQVTQRLHALQERLWERDFSLSGSSKADLRDRLATILQRPEYVKTVKEESALTRIMRRFFRWLASLFPERKALTPGRASAVSRFDQIFVVAIAVAAIAYALWMFAPRFLRHRKTKKPAKAKARVVLGERLEADKTSSDLLAEAEALARSGDLRGAIRRGYIALLIELADRKVISLAQYKTNRDYLRSVKDLRALHQNMEVLTNNFELHWYGLAAASEQDWAAFRTGYRQALSAN